MNGPSYSAPFNCSYRDFCNQSSPCYHVVPPPGSSGQPPSSICQSDQPKKKPLPGGTQSDDLWGCALIILRTPVYNSAIGVNDVQSQPVFVSFYVNPSNVYDGRQDIAVKEATGPITGLRLTHNENDHFVVLSAVQIAGARWEDLSFGMRASAYPEQKIQLGNSNTFDCTAERKNVMLAAWNQTRAAKPKVNF
jgi:hypothetical protein